MSNNNKARPELREIPSVDEIIDHIKGKMTNAPYTFYIQIIRQTLDAVRQEIRQGTSSNNIRKYTFSLIENAIKETSASNMKNVINGTGIILHTGLGRAPISKKLMKKCHSKCVPLYQSGTGYKIWKSGREDPSCGRPPQCFNR